MVDIPPREMLLDDGGPEGMDESAHGNSARVGSESPPAETASNAKTPGFMERVQARVRPDADYREEIVRSIFGEVGTPVEGDQDTCALGGVACQQVGLLIHQTIVVCT